MNTKDMTVISVLMAFEIGTNVLEIPGLSFIKIYFMASLVYVISERPNKILVFLVVLRSLNLVFSVLQNFPYYLSLSQSIIVMYGLKVDPWTVIWIVMCFLPFIQIIQIKGAQITIRRLKIRERIGGI